MAPTLLKSPYPIFTDKSGYALDNGYLYFGEINKNPETNPIQVYYDSEFTQPTAQPIRTSNGYVMRNGSPALIYADSNFSVTVRDKNSEFVIYSPVGSGLDASEIGYSPIVNNPSTDVQAAINFVSDEAAKSALSTASTTGATQDIDFSEQKIHLSCANTPTVTFSFSNPAEVAKVDLIIDYDLLSSFSISTATYDDISFSFQSEDSNSLGISFKTDGTKMYMLASNTDKIYQYSLLTAWDVGTATYDDISFSIISQDSAPYDVFFKTDGTKLYVVGASNDKVYQYSLSTAWAVGTATYDNISLSISSQDGNPVAISFKPDGTKLYVVGVSNDKVYQYSLSTEWNISTATYDSISLSVQSEDANPRSISFKPDGTKLYVLGNNTDKVYQYSLSTAWDVGTSTYDSISVSVQSEGAGPLSMYFKSNGTKMYILCAGKVYQYTTETSATLVFPSTMQSPEIPLETGKKTALTIITADSGTSYQVISAQGGII